MHDVPRAGRGPERLLVPDPLDRRRGAAAADARRRARRDRRAALEHARAGRASSSTPCTATSRCWRWCSWSLHILTSVLDSFAPISLIDAVVPFTGSYRPFWLGLGAVSFDLMLAVTITSLLRRRHRLRRPGARCTGSPTRAGRSRCCTASAPAATSKQLAAGAQPRLPGRRCSRAVLARVARRLAARPAPARRRAGRRRRVLAVPRCCGCPAARSARNGRGARARRARCSPTPRTPAVTGEQAMSTATRRSPRRPRRACRATPTPARCRGCCRDPARRRDEPRRAPRGARPLPRSVPRRGARARGAADRRDRARRAARPRRRRLPDGDEDARRRGRRAAARSWSSTRPRASRRASRTARCSRRSRTWCSTAPRSPPQAVGADEADRVRLRVGARAASSASSGDRANAPAPRRRSRSVDARDGPRPLRRRPGVGARQPSQRRPGEADVHAADALRARRQAPPDAGQQRRDARARRADRAPRRARGSASSARRASPARRSSRCPARSPTRACTRSSTAPRWPR